jgi:uncharacterized protein (DUF1330 family)
MLKGYWIAHIEVSGLEEYKKYVEANSAAYAKFGGRCLARGGRYEILEGNGRSRNVIWEFPSFEAAVACYNSAEYQAAREYRKSAAVGDFVVVEGLE